MQLIECSDCHKQVSDEAYSCPNCGKPMRRSSAVAKPLVLIACIFVFLIVPLVGLAFAFFSRSLLRNFRSSIKGVGGDILRRL